MRRLLEELFSKYYKDVYKVKPMLLFVIHNGHLLIIYTEIL